MQGPLRTSSAVVAIVMLLGHPAVSHGAPSKRACYQTCTEAKRDCAGEARTSLATAQADCTGAKARCKRDAKVARKGALATCGTSNAACRACCRDGDACAAPTTSTTRAPSTTTAVPTTSVPTTTSVTTTSTPGSCGNGVVDAGEACDPAASVTGCFVEAPFCAAGCGGCSSTCSELVLTLGPATADCGFPGQAVPASAPLSGELRDAAAMKTAAGDLGLGCLYIGGGLAAIVPPAPFPDGSTTVFHVSDCSAQALTLEPASTGDPTTCTVGPATTKHCVNGHPGTDAAGACTVDADCQPVCVGGHCVDGAPGLDGNGACTNNGNCGPSSIAGSAQRVCQPDPSCFFGNPVPIANAGLSICVVNTIEDGVTGAADKATGMASVTLPLESSLYLTGLEADYNPDALGYPCPRCQNGVCSAGSRKGLACSTSSTLLVTQDCPPAGHLFLAAIDTHVSPLTTADVTAFSDDQGFFCAAQFRQGAFGQGPVRSIVENGSPAAGGLDATARDAVLASVFCIPATGNGLIDAASNLPGPAAVSLGGSIRLR